MFTLLRILPIRRLAGEQVPALLGAWLIAEFFYKFHSFSLECGAFLLTWLALDAMVQILKWVIQRCTHSKDSRAATSAGVIATTAWRGKPR